jgi:hypothetical protein
VLENFGKQVSRKKNIDTKEISDRQRKKEIQKETQKKEIKNKDGIKRMRMEKQKNKEN